MGIVEIICDILNQVLNALSTALPQLDGVWTELGAALEEWCGQFSTVS